MMQKFLDFVVWAEKRINGEFIENGYEIVDFDKKADIYIINTCTVTNMADKKSRQMLHRVKQLNPKSVLVAVRLLRTSSKRRTRKSTRN